MARLLENLSPDLLPGVKVVLVSRPDPVPDGTFCGIDDFIRGAPDRELPAIKGDQPAITIFTSGTTGIPKPVTYNHNQLVLAATIISGRLGPFLPKQPRSACWLPLSSPFQRMINFCGIELNSTTYMVEHPRDLMDSVSGIRPHFLAGVPRFFEKLYEEIQLKMDRLPKVLSRLIALGEKAAMTSRPATAPVRPVPPGHTLLFRLAETLVFRRIRQSLGGHIRFLISGSAPLNPAIPQKFLSWGWLLLESYGVSENILPMAMNLPDRFRMGTVGTPMPGNQIRIARDGEILVRGKGVAVSGVTLTKDQFLKTGDIGHLDRDGFLFLKGRKSDMFKLSTGRKISPLAVETALADIPGVAHGVIYGAGRKFTVALVNIPENAWRSRVATAGSEPCARQVLFREINRACRSIPAYARPVDIAIVHPPFSVDTGELTGNLKLRRGFVLKKFAAELDRLYRYSDSTASGRAAS